MNRNDRKCFWAKLRTFFRKSWVLLHLIREVLMLIVYVIIFLEITGYIKK